MKKYIFLMFLFIVALSLLQTSCEKQTVQPKETDWDAVKAIISENPNVFRLGFFDAATDTLFYREITENNADIDSGIFIRTQAEDSILHLDPFFPYIILTWGDSLKGKFHYRFNGDSYEKPISALAQTNAYFEKWGDNSDLHRGWLLKKFSGTLINSINTTRKLYTVNIVSDGVDVTLNQDMLFVLAKKENTLIFNKGKQVTFTIDVADTSDFFFLHVKEGEAYQKIPFTSIGNEKFSASWTTTTDPNIADGKKYWHAIIDAVNRESVTDTTQYDSKAWGIIYRIK